MYMEKLKVDCKSTHEIKILKISNHSEYICYQNALKLEIVHRWRAQIIQHQYKIYKGLSYTMEDISPNIFTVAEI